MSKFILGKKVGMSQIFGDKGQVIPVTVIEVEPNVIVQLKTSASDGYEAVQVGTGAKKHLSKALKGHFKDLGNFRFVREFAGLKSDDKDLKVGDVLEVSLFQPGDKVKVTSTSKGKGFAGAVKRHGFHGMPASHGHRSVQRHIGSIGQRFPQHTLKGKRMAGRMGAEQVTTRGLSVVSVDVENKILALKGAVPGNRGELVKIQTL